MSQRPVTLAQKDILRLVRSFNGLYGPLAIEAAMRGLSQWPEKDWQPIVNHVGALISRGLVRCDQSTDRPRFFVTEAGERAIDGWPASRRQNPLLRLPAVGDNAAMSMPFQFTKRTGLFATGWLFLAAIAGWFGALALDYNTTAAVFGFVVAFNCFWAAVDSLRGRRFARIVLDRAILVFVMMMAYWLWRSNPQSTDTNGIDG